MTRRSILEYVKAISPRYCKSTRKVKTRILDEFVATTGMHRKASIRLLNRKDGVLKKKMRGRPREYNIEVERALRKVWEASDYLCSKRL